MSQRRRTNIAELDAPAVTPEPITETTSDPTEALKRRAKERFDQALNTYRQAVFSAADGSGQLPDDQLDAVVEACEVTGVPVEQFADDIVSVRRFRELAQHGAKLAAQHDENRQAVKDAAADIERLQRELDDAKKRVLLYGDHYYSTMSHNDRERNEMTSRFPHLFWDAASVTAEMVRKKLTTRAFFVR